MVRLSELKKKWEELKKAQEEEQYRVEELTIIDCADGIGNLSCFTVEKRIPIIIPKTVEKADEVRRLIESGRMIKAKLKMRSWSDRVESIEEIKEISEDEIEVDGEFVISPGSFGGFVARSDGQFIIIKPGTINYRRLVELYERGVDVVALKLSNVQSGNSGRIKVTGIWIYPLKTGEPVDGSVEVSESGDAGGGTEEEERMILEVLNKVNSLPENLRTNDEEIRKILQDYEYDLFETLKRTVRIYFDGVEKKWKRLK